MAKVVASGAWSERAIGCYAVWLRLVGPMGPADRAAQQLVDGFEHAGFSVRNGVSLTPTTHRFWGLHFTKGSYTGLLRAELANVEELDVVACAWNQREPSICAPACKKLVKESR